MFEIAFSEILVIMVVALVVIGPERLPQVARTLGRLWGRLQRYINQVKQEVNSSMELQELREVEQQVKTQTGELERSLLKASSDIDSKVKQIENELADPNFNSKVQDAQPATANQPKNNP